MRIAVTRPEEDSGPLQAKLEALGHVTVAAPLLTIAPREGVKIPDRPWQAVAVTSANGIRALPPGALAKTVRMLTVGPQSLKAAREAGFQAEAHGGDVNGLARFIIENLCYEDGPILYLSGQETAGDLEAQLTAARFDCVRIVLYDAVPATALGEAGLALSQGELDAVLLYSPRSARIWRALVEQAGLQQMSERLQHLCLSRNVAAVLPENWPARIAATPDEAAMLALLEQMR